MVEGDRDCLMGHEWCNGPDGDTVSGEAFGGLCGTCYIKQSKEKTMNGREPYDEAVNATAAAMDAFENGNVWRAVNYLRIAVEYGEILERQEELKAKDTELIFDGEQ